MGWQRSGPRRLADPRSDRLRRSPPVLGAPQPRRLDEPVVASPEDLVPADHVYRHLERTLDLGFVRDLVKDAYADRGRPGVDPVANVMPSRRRSSGRSPTDVG